MTAGAQRRLVLHLSVSLDGFVARRDGVVDWLGTGEQHGAARHHANLEMIGQAGLIVLGRGAYQDMVEAWSTSDSPMARLITACRRWSSPTAAANRKQAPRGGGLWLA